MAIARDDGRATLHLPVICGASGRARRADQRSGRRPPCRSRRSCRPAAPGRRARRGRAGRARARPAAPVDATRRAARPSARSGSPDEHRVDREPHEHHVDAVAVGQPQAGVRRASDGRPIRPMNLRPEPRRRPRRSAARTRAARSRFRARRRRRSAPGPDGVPEVALARRPASGVRFCMIRMIAGPRMTMNSDGKMQPTSGNSILIGALAAMLLGALAALDAELLRLDLEHLRDRHAELLGLDDRADEVRQRRDLGPRDDVAERLAARLADADLGQRPAELVDERALRASRRPCRARRRSRGRPGRRSSAGRGRPGSGAGSACWRFLTRPPSQNSGIV